MDLLDLDLREERPEIKQPIKKNIPLKIKSSSNLICSSTNFVNNAQNINNETPFFHSSSNQDQVGTNLNSYNGNIDYNKTKGDVNFNLCQGNHLISNLNYNLSTSVKTQKIQDQKMDYCMSCLLPILIYGRLIPCKHVMCFECANKNGLKFCIKDSCNENIERIEKVLAGRIFVCSYEQDDVTARTNSPFVTDKSLKNQCGRSYMSQRDLDAHIKHRHHPNLNLIE